MIHQLTYFEICQNGYVNMKGTNTTYNVKKIAMKITSFDITEIAGKIKSVQKYCLTKTVYI